MPTINDFKAFAINGAANVLTQPEYEALSSLRNLGFQSGVASSAELNKVWRQASVIAYAVGEMIRGRGMDALDDGDTAAFLTKFFNALAANGYAVDTGTSSAYVITLDPAPTSLEDGAEVSFKATNTSTVTNPTLNVNGIGALVITSPGGGALSIGDIVGGAIYAVRRHASGNRWELQSISPAGASPSGGSYSAYNDLVGANVLTSTDAGSLNDITTANNQTLPLAADMIRGQSISFTATAAGSVIRQGADTLTINGSAGLTSQAFTVGGFMICTSDGVSVWTCNYIPPSVGTVSSMQVFTGSGTYTRPAGLVKAKVTVIGQGGSGAAASPTVYGGGGGGGGGTAIRMLSAATIGASQSVTIGATCSFGALCSASAGSNGSGANGGVGGIGASGDINIRGASGSPGDDVGSGPVGAHGGNGGSSTLGGGGAGGSSTSRNGGGGGNYGGGGGGAGADGVSSGGTTGAGANGIVIVEEFY